MVDEFEMSTLSWERCSNVDRLRSSIGYLITAGMENLQERQINTRQHPLGRTRPAARSVLFEALQGLRVPSFPACLIPLERTRAAVRGSALSVVSFV